MTAAVVAHYARPGLGEAILDALRAAGKDVDRLVPDDLAAIDEFHTRGRAATVDLARLVGIQPSDRILDLGCGIGGPVRYLAATFGCSIIGIDLTPEFCDAATMLAGRTGLSAKVAFRQGDALDIPFADRSFDVVWSQNVAMNIADRDRMYDEIARVLKPGGRYAFADVTAGNGGMLHFPVPWARRPSESFLLTAADTVAKLTNAGFHISAFEDQTKDAIAQQKARVSAAGAPSGLGVHVVLGSDAATMLKNTIRNFEEGLANLIHGVAVRTS